MNRAIHYGIIGCVLITVLMHKLYFMHLTDPPGSGHGDSYFVIFVLNHWMDIFTGQLPSSDWRNLPMYAGFGAASLGLGEHYLGPAFLAMPMYLVTRNIFITYNAVVLITFFLSLFSMYVLAWYVSKNIWSSMLAAVIFVCNPYMMFRFPDHLLLGTLFWIPLIFLFCERMLLRPSAKRCFVFFCVTACQLLFGFYYSIYLTLLLPLYIVFRWIQIKPSVRTFLNRGTLFGSILLVLVGWGNVQFYPNVKGKDRVYASPQFTSDFFSPLLSDFLFTSRANIFYGNLKSSAEKTYPDLVRTDPFDEQNLFIGVTPLILLLISLVALTRKGKVKVWMILLIITVLLSFGPDIHITGTLAVPNIIYQSVSFIHPLYGQLRVPSRIMVFHYFFASLLIALSLSKKRAGVIACLIALTMFEYQTKSVDFLSFPPATREFYKALRSDNHIQTIVDLPIANALPAEALQSRYLDLDAQYLLWQTMHGKNILNGYSSIIPKGYYEFAQQLSVHFPTPDKLSALREKGIDAILIHGSAVNLKKDLKGLGVEETIAGDGFSLFDLTSWYSYE